MWARNREAIIFLGGGRAALLQLAHPFVAQAVADHSRTREDMLGRFLRTFEHGFARVWGDLDAAVASARRVHAIHTHIHGVVRETAGGVIAGTRYDANLPEIRAIVPNADGSIYVAALGGSIAKRAQSASQASQSGAGGGVVPPASNRLPQP